jgi:hypothetical protein
MQAQIAGDLAHGFAGCLDALTPRAASDLFADRIDAEGSWWDAETRGNWLLGYLMAAHLVEDPGHRARAEALLDALEATADEDGYVGIYAPARRYAHPAGENGELWAQSRALLALLASYEATGRTSRLAVAARAAALTMGAYGPGRAWFTPGGLRGGSALTGLTHGLCWTDVAARLHALTGRREYAAFGAWLYRDFSSVPRPFPNDDLALGSLLDEHGRWSGHAVHTAEHLRALLLARDVEGGEVLELAWSRAIARLERHTLPSGALVGDESVHDAPSPASGYEYCTTTELLVSLSAALVSTADARFGDRVERIAFNAAQGARLADGCAVAYLSRDTRLEATAELTDGYSEGRPGRRFKFSPTHEDVACCCNPNAVRLLPSYVSRAWLGLADRAGVALALYGPSRVAADVAGTRVTLEQQTAYPFEDEVSVLVRCERTVTFELWLRVPEWAARMDVRAPGRVATHAGAATSGRGWHRICGTWRDGDEVEIAFATSPRVERYGSGEHAVLRGAVQYVQPVAHVSRAIRDYPLGRFQDLELRRRDPATSVPALDEGAVAAARISAMRSARVRDPWASAPIALVAGPARLVPMGCAPLRVAGFESNRD